MDLAALFSKIKHNITTFDCDKVLWCGDFNTVLSDLDIHNGSDNRNHEIVRRCLLPVLESCEFADVFRVFHPSEKRFTHIKKNYGARLDYIFASLNIVNCIDESEIGIAFVTDHAPNLCHSFQWSKS